MVLRSFVTHAPNYFATIREFAPDKAEPSIETFRIAAHSIKGSGRSIGAEELGALAEKMEKAAAASDFDYILSNREKFLDTAEKIISSLDAFLKTRILNTKSG